MIAQFLIFGIGSLILYFGARWLIRGSASLAIRYGIRPMIVGLTVVALGTSMPEFVVNFIAALQNESDLALGNIIGSNIANIGLILGISALILPLHVAAGTLRKEYPIMMAVMLLFYFMASDGVIDRTDGIILVSCLVAFLAYMVYEAKHHPAEVSDLSDLSEVRRDDMQAPAWKRALLIVGGIAALTFGARLMVMSAVAIAIIFDIHPMIVGLTIVAIGTSLPELATCVVGAVQRESDLSVGNVLGSNVFNVLFIVGLVAIVHALPVDGVSLQIHFPVMLGFGFLLLPLAWTGFRLNRFEGFLLLSCFIAYILYLILPLL